MVNMVLVLCWWLDMVISEVFSSQALWFCDFIILWLRHPRVNKSKGYLTLSSCQGRLCLSHAGTSSNFSHICLKKWQHGKMILTPKPGPARSWNKHLWEHTRACARLLLPWCPTPLAAPHCWASGGDTELEGWIFEWWPPSAEGITLCAKSFGKPREKQTWIPAVWPTVDKDTSVPCLVIPLDLADLTDFPWFHTQGLGLSFSQLWGWIKELHGSRWAGERFGISAGAETVKEIFGWFIYWAFPCLVLVSDMTLQLPGAVQRRAEQLQPTLKAAFAQGTRIQNICTWICFSF